MKIITDLTKYYHLELSSAHSNSLLEGVIILSKKEAMVLRDLLSANINEMDEDSEITLGFFSGIACSETTSIVSQITQSKI